MTRQATDQLYIELNYFTPEEYYTYEAVAQSALTAESSLDCEGTVTASGVVVIASGDLPAFATLTAMISHIEGADLVAFAESTVGVDFDRIRSVSSNLSSESTLGVDINRTRQGSSELIADSTFNATATIFELTGEIVEASGSWTNTASLDVQVSKIVNFASTMSAEFQQTATISHIEGADLFAFAEAQLAIEVSRIRDNNIEAASAFNVATDAVRTVFIAAQADSQVNVESVASRTRGYEAAVDAAFSLDITARNIKQGAADFTSAFTPTLTADAFKNSFAILDSIAELSVQGNLIRQTEITALAESSVVAQVSQQLTTSAQITSNFGLEFLGAKVSRIIGDPILVTSPGSSGVSIVPSPSKFGGGAVKFDSRPQVEPARYAPVYGPAGFLTIRGLDGFDSTPGIKLHLSTDGVNWSEISNTIAVARNSIRGLFYLNNLYVILATENSRIVVITSSDASTWTTHTSASTFAVLPNKISYANNRWHLYATGILSGSIFRNFSIRTTTDLVNYTEISSGTLTGNTQIFYDNINYVDAVSFDSTSLVFMAAPVFATSDSNFLGNDVYYSYSKNGTSYVGAGPFDGSANTITDGWAPTSVATNGSRWMVAGTNGRLYYTDTIPNSGSIFWTQVDLGITSTISSLTYVNDLWVAQTTTAVYTSSNGITWTAYAVSNPTVGPFIAKSQFNYTSPKSDKATYGSNKWIIGQQTSSDGVNWNFLDYQIPNRQSFLTYPDNDSWSTWKSVDFWMYVAAETASSRTALISQYTNGSNFFAIELNAGSTFRQLIFTTPASIRTVTVTSTLPVNAWNHIRIVNDSGNMSLYVNGTRVLNDTASATYGNSSAALCIGYGYFDSTRRTADLYFDEILINQEVLNSPSLTSINVPTAPWVNTDNTSLLLHFDNNFADDAVIVITSVSASLASQFNIVANGGLTIFSEADLSSETTVNVDAKKVITSSASLSAEGFVVAAFGRIRPFASLEDTAFTLIASVDAVKPYTASLQSSTALDITPTKTFGEFTVPMLSSTALSADAQTTTGSQAVLESQGFLISAFGRIRPDVADLNSAFELDVEAFVGKVGQGDLSSAFEFELVPTKQLGAIIIAKASNFALTATAQAIPSGSVSASAITELAIEYTRLRLNAAELESTTSMTTLGDVNKEFAISVQTNADLTAIALRIQQLNSQFSAVASSLSAVNKIGSVLIDSAVTASLDIDARVNASGVLLFESNTAMAVSGEVNKPFSADLDIESNLTVQGDVGLFGRAELSTQASTVITAQANLDGSAALTSQFAVAVDTGAIRDNIALQFSFADTVVNAEVLRGLTANTEANTTVNVQASRIRTASAALSAEGFVLSTGRVINLEASAIWRIVADNNYYDIPEEISIWTISKDRTPQI
jgi:hypothetical protein